MQKYKVYIYCLILSIFIQNSSMLFELIDDYFGTESGISLLLEKSENCKSEEDTEDNEKESKENETKEKEKELKNYYTTDIALHNAVNALKHSDNTTVSEIFTAYFETETPPPKQV